MRTAVAQGRGEKRNTTMKKRKSLEALNLNQKSVIVTEQDETVAENDE